MLALAAALLHTALAAEPEDTEDPDAAEEIIVFGQLEVEAARQQVIADLKDQGFTKIKEKDGKTILKNQTVWRGKVVLHDDGWMEHRRQGIQGETPDSWFKREAPPLAWMPCILSPHQCIRIGGLVISPTKLAHVKTRTHQAVGEDLAELSNRVADLNVDRTVNDLPDRLASCWEDGVPLVTDGPLESQDARLDEILAFWESRTHNEWGDRVREATEAYIRGVIQHEVDTDLKEKIRRTL